MIYPRDLTNTYSITSLEGLVVVVVSGHDKVATHLIKFMPAHSGGGVGLVRPSASTETELVVVNVQLDAGMRNA